jgi:hypothetical protein
VCSVNRILSKYKAQSGLTLIEGASAVEVTAAFNGIGPLDAQAAIRDGIDELITQLNSPCPASRR